jgi:hypothetical protein
MDLTILTELEKLKQELQAYTYFIGQAQTDEERAELKNKYNKDMQRINDRIKILESSNGES